VHRGSRREDEEPGDDSKKAAAGGYQPRLAREQAELIARGAGPKSYTFASKEVLKARLAALRGEAAPSYDHTKDREDAKREFDKVLNPPPASPGSPYFVPRDR
jgi:hypothetical protein